MVHHLFKPLLILSIIASPLALGSHGPRRHADVEGKAPTNAMRMANGMPPLAPRKLYDGSKTENHQPRNSPHPPHKYGAIVAYDSNGLRGGHQLGFVSQHFNALGAYFVTDNCTAAMSNIELIATHGLINPANPGGFQSAGLVASLDFNPQGAFGMVLGGTEATPYRSFPLRSIYHSVGNGADEVLHTQVLSNTSYLIESSVWSLQENKELIATWINPEGDAAEAVLTYFPSIFATIVTTLNLTRYQEVETSEVEQIRLFLSDKPACAA